MVEDIDDVWPWGCFLLIKMVMKEEKGKVVGGRNERDAVTGCLKMVEEKGVLLAWFFFFFLCGVFSRWKNE